MGRTWADDYKGVEVKSTGKSDEVSICYHGLLAKNGADCVYVHCGTGDPRHWKNVNTFKMDKASSGFEKNIKVVDETFVCFKDSASNWDNNSGWNWEIK